MGNSCDWNLCKVCGNIRYGDEFYGCAIKDCEYGDECCCECLLAHDFEGEEYLVCNQHLDPYLGYPEIIFEYLTKEMPMLYEEIRRKAFKNYEEKVKPKCRKELEEQLKNIDTSDDDTEVEEGSSNESDLSDQSEEESSN
jgi:hypothetical protein